MADQLITQATVMGFAPNQTDLLQMSDGFHQIYVYVAGDASNIRPGQTYTVYKQNSLYYLGQQLNGSQ